MEKLWTPAPWLTRFIVLAKTFLFGLIAFRCVAHPVQASAAAEITLDEPLAATILRIGFGAFPLGLLCCYPILRSDPLDIIKKLEQCLLSGGRARPNPEHRGYYDLENVDRTLFLAFHR